MAKTTRTIKLVNKTLIKQRKKAILNLYLEMARPSWREFSRLYYGSEIKHGVLNRFANDPKYIPTDEFILDALGLIKQPNPYRVLPKYFERTPQALAYYRRTQGLIREASAASKQLLKEARG